MTEDHDHRGSDGTAGRYLRFLATIAVSMVVMYAAMFAGTWEWEHVRFSESRVFMTMTMGGTMALVMLVGMSKMYRNVRANVSIVVGALVLIAGGITLDRTQAPVDDVAYMNAMIPHHSLAITRSERVDLADARVCELAASISTAQRREILEMAWLVDDIRANGVASTASDAERRAAPEFPDAVADRTCAADRP